MPIITDQMLHNKLKRLINLTGNKLYCLKYYEASKLYQLVGVQISAGSWAERVPGIDHRYPRTKMFDVLRAYIAGIELGGVMAIKGIQGG